MSSFKTIVEFLCIVCVITVDCENNNTNDLSVARSFSKLYSTCGQSNNFFKCLKVQALKLADKVDNIQQFRLLDGVQIVKKPFTQKNNGEDKPTRQQVINLPTEQIDALLVERTGKFLKNHEIQVDIPRLLTVGFKDGQSFLEGRGKKMKKYLGPFVAAVAIKGGILTMVYHSIAIIAGKALIIGKIALVISAIIGLKKLVQPEGSDKTTYEIVKKPIIQQSYSSSHADFDAHEGGQYHRSLGGIRNDMLMQDRMYKGYL